LEQLIKAMIKADGIVVAANSEAEALKPNLTSFEHV
jgi:hypothetical protein